MMTEKAKQIHNDFIDKYQANIRKQHTTADKLWKAVARDDNHKLAKTFFKMFGKPLDKAEKL